MLQGNIQSGPLTGSVWTCKKEKKKRRVEREKERTEERKKKLTSPMTASFDFIFLF